MINRLIDHTLLKPEATRRQISKLCKEAKEYHFASVCVNPCHVAWAFKKLKDSDVKVCTVIGFPLGANVTATKVFETKKAIKQGASEIDMVINIGAVKDKNYKLVRKDIEAVRKACANVLLKVILETCLLTNEEIVKVSEICMEVGADYVKTSTGFSKGGATIEAVKLMADTVKGKGKVKASGGIHNYEEAKAMVDAGASRIGASSGVAIVEGEKNK